MPLQLQPPASGQSTPGLPDGPQLLEFRGFRSLNTKPSRPAIKDDEMSWCDNWMPLGEDNLRTLYANGPPLTTPGGGRTVKYFNFGNIEDVSYCIVILDDGSILAVKTSDSTFATIAPAGTIVHPTATTGISQWGSQYILICAGQTNGYFVWDGTIFYMSGGLGPTVNLLSAGSGYSAAPTVSFVGGAGAGATATVSVSGGSVSDITITNPGTGYTVNDAVVLKFTGGSAPTRRTATGTATVVNQAVTAIAVADGGAGYTATTAVLITGGGGSGATATVTVVAGAVTGFTVTAGGQGYLSAPTIVVFDPNNSIPVATAILMPFGVSGTALEVYSSRVWLVNGDAFSTPPPRGLVEFSAPGSPIDFSVANGAGAFIGTNSFLRVGYHSLKQSNGFLYLVGDSSVDYIAGVSTSGSPAITTFTNQNVDPQVGSPWPYSTQVFSRSVVFGNAFGIHGLYGGAVQKVSAPLDGFYATVTINNSPLVMKPSSAVAVIFGIHVFIMLMPVIDPLTGTQRNALLMWDGSRWWTASQLVPLTQIASLEINSVLTCYGTDGTSIYPLFQTPSTSLVKTVQSKQWGTPGFMSFNQMMRTWTLIKQYQTSAAITMKVDYDTTPAGASGSVTYTLPAATNWMPAYVQAVGILLGFTMSTTSLDIALISHAGLAHVEGIKV